MKRVILLGGGHVHLHVLQALAAQPLPGAEVMLLSPLATTLYSGMLPGVAAGHYAPQDAEITLAPLAEQARALFVEQSAAAIDAAARTVTLADGRRAEYDLLSVDVGSVQSRDTIAGAREHGLFLRPIEHFARLLPGLIALGGTRALDVVVIGGGAAGVEIAMALAHRLADPVARVVLVTGGSAPLADAPPSARAAVLRALRRLRVTVLQELCAAVESDHVRLANGARVACDAPIIATAGSAPPWLAGSGLALDDRGRIRTGPTLQSVSHPDVLAAGDVVQRDDVPHPHNGVHAVRAGPPLVASLRALIGGVPPPSWQPPQRTLNLVSCGQRRAIAIWGEHAAEGRWLWWWKHRIDRAYVARFAVRPERTDPTMSIVGTKGDQQG